MTPCHHAFHPKCLRQWSLIKMECPICRLALLPIYSLDGLSEEELTEQRI